MTDYDKENYIVLAVNNIKSISYNVKRIADLKEEELVLKRLDMILTHFVAGSIVHDEAFEQLRKHRVKNNE